MISTLPPELEAFVESEVSAGEFASRDEVLAAAVRLFQQQRLSKDDSIEEIRQLLKEDEEFAGEDIVLKTSDDFRAFAESVKTRGRERLAQQRSGHE